MLTSIRRASSREPGAAGARQGTAATAAANARKDERVHEPDLRDDEFEDVEGREAVRRRAAELLEEGRPAVLGVPGDEGRENRGRDRERRGGSAGETSQRLSEGALTKASATPAAKKAAVNFDCSMSPSARPIARSHRALPVRQSSTSAARPSVQNTTSGASGVTNTAPAITSGIAIHIRTASAAVSAERKSRQAMRATSAGSAPTRRSDSARTPSSEPPKSVVEARMTERDHRRMVEIAEGERARPERVIGFVEGEFEAPRGERLQGEERDRSADREAERAGCAAVASRAALRRRWKRPSRRRLRLSPASRRAAPVAWRRAGVNRSPSP